MKKKNTMIYKCQKPTFYSQQNLPNAGSETFYHFMKNSLNLMASEHLKKVGTGPCFPLCSTPSSFNNICKHLELRSPAAGPLGEECRPIPVRPRTPAAQQSWVSLLYFVFHNSPNVFSW